MTITKEERERERARGEGAPRGIGRGSVVFGRRRRRRRNRKSSMFGNDGRSIYLEETKAPPMAIISRVYMHRSVHCSVH